DQENATAMAGNRNAMPATHLYSPGRSIPKAARVPAAQAKAPNLAKIRADSHPVRRSEIAVKQATNAAALAALGNIEELAYPAEAEIPSTISASFTHRSSSDRLSVREI
ncbi:hypothetical protein U1Q18_002477, partial [Sarracenia purpurea var. burkii]